jgi:spore coat polysaccharide biosynthesis protein SpsF (cytidylyltransferase family)
MEYDNHIKKSYNKMRTTWKIINMEAGRTTKKDDTQYLIDKHNDQNVAELLNDYFLTIANKIINTLNSNQNNTQGTKYMLFIQQAIINKYPNRF